MSAKNEMTQLKQQEPLGLYVGEVTRPFSKMKHVGYPVYEFSDVKLRFGKIDFTLNVSRNEVPVPGEKWGFETLYDVQLNCRIFSMEELEWLQKYIISFSNPLDTDKNSQNNLTILTFDHNLEMVDPKKELDKKGHVDLTFYTDIYNFAFQNEELRSKIEMKITNKTIPPHQRPLTLSP